MRRKGEYIDTAALERSLRKEVDGEVRFDTASRALYVSDASNYRQVPIGVVLPRSKDAVVATVGVCNQFGAPVTSRGGGTGLCGQTCNTAVIIDFSKHMNRIVELHPDRKSARVLPGTILDHLRDEAEKHHLTFGPDPATHTHNTLGGMLGNNSCGIHSIMAGRTADNVYELEVITYDGLRMRVGETPEAELTRIIAAGGRRGQIYGGMKGIRDRYGDLIRKRYPKIPRRVSGYNLDDLLPENNFHVGKALVGSEGTLVTILEANLRLVYSPPGRSLLVLGYPDVYSAGDHIPEIMGYGPVGCEGIDNLLIEYMERKGLNVSDIPLLPPGGGWLLVEFGGKDKEEADNNARKAMESLKKSKNPPSMKLYTDRNQEKLVWEIRESGLGATANVPGMPLTWPGWEDAAVDPRNVGKYLRDFRGLLQKFNLQASLYGHFGQGCIHCRISFDLFTNSGIRRYMEFIDHASDLVVKYGGSFSAEHGDGQSKAIFLPKMYGKEIMRGFREFKSLWDPQWKMNPGKVIEPYRPDQNLRFGVNYQPWQSETHFGFTRDEGSFSRATLRCVGVGKCRRVHDAFMCPSFLATREELHTTRGRAHMLFEMFRGDFVRDGWRSREVLEALSLCLGCKGCRGECPVEVDIATYKSEFLSHYYEGRLRPRAAYSMGLIGYWNELAGKAPVLAVILTQTPVLRSLAKLAAGIAQARPLPKYAPVNFYDWYSSQYSRVPGSWKRGEALLYPDYLNNYFFPVTMDATARILAGWGFRVLLPPRRPAALRPLLHYGMLDLTKREMERNIRMLAPYARAGIPIVHLEPSELSAYVDELPGLFPNDRDGQRVRDVSMLIGDLIIQKDLKLPRLEGKAVFHGHCHQKAVLNVESARQVLRRMGLEFEEPQPGCCGMSGSFGFETKSYHISKRISEEHLLPAVRKAGINTYIVADGFSCRSQILDGTGRQPFHLAELVQHAYALQRRKIVKLGRKSKEQCPHCRGPAAEEGRRMAAKKI